MSDPTGNNPSPVAPQVPPEPEGEWSASLVGKKLAWAFTIWKSSTGIGAAAAPFATQAVEKISAMFAPSGITLHINQPVFDQALPIFIFSMLVMGHDYAKFKTGARWL